MLATIIDESNRQVFFPDGNEPAGCSLFIGAVHEETDTACGILGVDSTEDSGIAIRYLYVAEEYRRMGTASGASSVI